MVKRGGKKAAFTFPYELNSLTKRPFRIKREAASSQIVMNLVLVSLSWQPVLVYLHSIVVFSKPRQDCIEKLRLVLPLLYKLGTIPKLNRYKCFVKKIVYSGRITRPSHLRRAEHITVAVVEQVPSSTWTEPCSFLGLYNVSGRFFPKLRVLRYSSQQQARKNRTKEIGQLHEKESAVTALLEGALIRALVPRLPTGIGQFTIGTEARVRKEGV